MQLPDVSMQESSRGASPDWTSLRGPSANAVLKRFNFVLVEKLFPFFAVGASIARVAHEWSAEMVPSPKYNFVVDSPILSVI